MNNIDRKEAEALEVCIGKVASFCKEIGALSKKTPNDAVNKFKLKFVNSTIGEVNNIQAFLKDAPEGKYLDLLDEVSLPQAADLILVMSQYEGALKAFHERHHGTNPHGSYGWYTED